MDGCRPRAVGMHRQGYDLQLDDERGWRATFYTTGLEHSQTSATAPRGSGDATQRGSVGGVEASESRLGSVFLPLPALKFPSHKAPMMEAIVNQSARRSVEFNLELGHVRLQQFAAYRTDPSSPAAAPRAVLAARRQYPVSDRGAGFNAETRQVRHSGSSLVSQMFT